MIEYKDSESTIFHSHAGVEGIEILVFKTNLSNNRHIARVMPALNLHPYIKEWNVDLQDRDHVLRVVAEKIQAKEVERIIVGAGYTCEELE